jgi:L-asparagine transporter-like permease
MPAGVVMSWISLLFFAFSIFIMIFDPDTLKALMATPLWFVALWLFWKIKQKGRANAAGEAERLTECRQQRVCCRRHFSKA